MDYTIVVVAVRGRPGPAAVHRPLRRHGDGRVLHVRAGPRHARASTTTCRSRPPRTASCRCWCAVRRAARRIPATCSTATAACSNAPPSWPRRWVIVAERRRRREGRRRLGRQQGVEPDRSGAAGRQGQGLRRPARERRHARGQARPARTSPATSSPRSPAPAAR